MTEDIRIFVIILAANTFAVFLYVFYFLFKKRGSKNEYLLKGLVMLICPVLGELYFFFSWLFQHFFFKNAIDLIDVIFSKERSTIMLNAEEEHEKNMMPLEEAIKFGDKDNVRETFLYVIKEDQKSSLGSIALALESEDSELAHYAASIIQAKLDSARRFVNETGDRILELEETLQSVETEDGDIITEECRRFRASMLQKGTRNMEEDADSAEKMLYYADISPNLESSEDYSRRFEQAIKQGQFAKYGDLIEEKTIYQKLTDEMSEAHKLIQEIESLLSQDLMTEFEERMFIETMNRISLLIEKRDVISAWELEVNVLRNIEIKEYETAEEWIRKLFIYYPDDIACYSSKLKLLYAQERREEFFNIIDEMKRSDISFNREMVELVRFFD